MKQGFLSAVMGDRTFEEVIDFASENGFSCVEVACWPTGGASRRYAGVTHIDVEHLDREKAGYLNTYCARRGVEISALAYYPNMMDPDPEKRRYVIRHLKRVIEAANVLGVGTVNTFVGRMPEKNVEENIREFREVWPPLVAFAEQLKIRIAIENCPMLFTEDEWPGGKNLACTPPIWRRLFSILPSRFFGLNYDPSHFVWMGIDYIKPVYEFRDRIFHVHYKDIKLHKERLAEQGVLAPPLSYMTPRIPGHGDVNWAEFISALHEIGYQGPACIEIEDRSFEGTQQEIENALLISKRYLSQFTAFESAGGRTESESRAG